jgi:hypothetical protein
MDVLKVSMEVNGKLIHLHLQVFPSLIKSRKEQLFTPEVLEYTKNSNFTFCFLQDLCSEMM